MEEKKAGVEWRVLALQLVVFPLSIVAACVGIFLLFGRLADDHRDARTLLQEIRKHDSSLGWAVWDRNPRWIAAYALPWSIAKERESLRQDPGFCRELIELFEDPSYPDPEIRAVMASAMGQLGDPQAVPALIRGLGEPSEERLNIRGACAWALGALKAPEAVSALSALLEDPSPSLRKRAAFALGSIGDREALRVLRQALEDASPPVRWTAAVWMGKGGESLCAPVLASFLDRRVVEAMPEIQPEERETVLAEAARAAGSLRSPDLKPPLEALARDPSPRVSLAAQEALISLGKP